LDSNLFGTGDGRIATVSSPSSPPFKIRIYTISDDGKTFTWDEDIELTDGVNLDNHGFTLVSGRYLVLISYRNGARVWDIHKDQLVEDISWNLRPNNIGNPTFVSHDHKNNRIIIGDYRDSDFAIYNDTRHYLNVTIDEVRTYSTNLSPDTIAELSFHAPNYSASYISQEFSSKGKNWDLFNITASIPSGSAIDLNYESLAENGSIIDERYVSIINGTNTYPISPIDASRSRIRLNLTTDFIETSSRISNLTLKTNR
jgi:hypothetical protein